MKIYAQLNTSLFIVDLTNNIDIPSGYIEMNIERLEGDWHAKADGKWYLGDPEKEALFVDNEMQLIAEQLLMHEDSDELAIATESDWREYRKQLRKWNWEQNEHFPDPNYRPKRPE